MAVQCCIGALCYNAGAIHRHCCLITSSPITSRWVASLAGINLTTENKNVTVYPSFIRLFPDVVFFKVVALCDNAGAIHRHSCLIVFYTCL